MIINIVDFYYEPIVVFFRFSNYLISRITQYEYL